MAYDTIAAIATGVGGGVGIVRLSGREAEPIVASLVIGWPKRAQTHRLYLGNLRHPASGEIVDEVLGVVMRAPHSYTGEDVAEIHGHGGRRILERVLAAVLASGARLAQPGEFTRRAFESGRIDLTRAEAVAQLISARSDRALAAAQSLHGGALAEEVAAARRRVVVGLAELEGALDFPDEAGDARPEAHTGRELAAVGERLQQLAGSYRKLVHDGAEIVLLGRVNAGKSSLFNRLVGEERALVDAQAGTTRDLVEAECDLGGVTVRLVDTAGERFGDAMESIEERGLELARRRRGRADAFLLVVDATVGFGEGESALCQELSGAPIVLAWNKRDVGPPVGNSSFDFVETSARTGEGVDGLRAALLQALGGAGEEGALVVSQRQSEALGAAAASLAHASSVLLGGEPSEVAAVEARRALHHLGRVTGETVDVEVLDAIFARFCIGK